MSGSVLNPVEEAVRLSQDVSLRENVKQELEAIQLKIEKLQKLQSTLFRLEENGRKEIEETLRKLQTRKKELEGYGKHAEKCKLLSMEVFKLRDGKGWPKLAIFDLNSPICSLRMHCFKRDNGEKFFVRESVPEYGHLPTKLGIFYF